MRCLTFSVMLLFCINKIHTQPNKNITLHTNIVDILNVGIDIPLPKNFSLYTSLSAFEFPILDNISNYNQRVSIRKYIISNKSLYQKYSPYCYTGVRFRQSKKHTEIKPNLYEIGKLDVTYISLGFGLKKRYFDFWIGSDIIANTKKNIFYKKQYYGQPYNIRNWKSDIGLSFGVTVNIFNIKLIK